MGVDPAESERRALAAVLTTLSELDSSLKRHGVRVQDVTLEGTRPSTSVVVRWHNERAGRDEIDAWLVWPMLAEGHDGEPDADAVGSIVWSNLLQFAEHG